MTQSGNTIKEKIKNVVLVVLFLFTILLLYFFWKGAELPRLSLSDFRFNDGKDNVIAVSDVVVPSHIDICFDNETYTKISAGKEAYWNGNGISVLEAFKTVVSMQDTYTEEITKEQYEEIMRFVSLRAVFEYYLPFDEYCSFLSLNRPKSTDAVGSISEIGFSQGSTESMFIYDGKNDKYFRIVSDFSSAPLLEEAKLLGAEENQTYYPLEQYVGSELRGRVLIPSILETDIAPLRITRDFGEADGSEAEAAARSFFSGNFDFVRKIEEKSGRIIYMYGYGERTLTTDKDGSLEYRAQPDRSGNGGGSDKYFASLEKALIIVADQGGFVTSTEQKLTPYIAYAGEIGGGGYRFEFGFTAGGENVYFENGNPLEIEICDGQAVYFKRHFLNFDEEKAHIRGLTETASALNVIAGDYESIYKMLRDAQHRGNLILKNAEKVEQDLLHSSDERFNYVADAICDMSSGYLYREEENELTPCYVLFMNSGNLAVYFDIYTADFLGFNNFAEGRTQENVN
ncbi:MAG: hypothetical protein HFG67_01395 [Firmicutes bacterium]|nr:hypothetical protein [Bacillota bacterium]